MSAHEHIHSSKSNEWRTPAVYVNAAREVMGGIDLDPASCAEANEHVRAVRFISKEEQGLTYDWHGNVWLNPPYGRGEYNQSNQGLWSAYLLDQFERGYIDQAVLLVNNTPDRSWFWPLWHYPICFTYRRIRFVAMQGAAKHSPTHGNAFVYLGPNVVRFRTFFSDFGHVVLP